MPLIHVDSGKPIARGYGVFSHYRLLDVEKRYGDGAWSWPSRARLLDDGAVEVDWPFDDTCPFTMRAVYRWADPLTLDLITTVTARRDVQRLEVFLASYFDGFPGSFVYVQDSPSTAGRPGFLEASRERGVWQMFPRDEAAVRMIQDGRWQRLPHPVDWQILPKLAAPLAMRRDAESDLAALVMARPEDCFAVATPYGEESHRSLYLSLLGRDLQAGESSTARTRLAIRSGLSDAAAVECYEAFCRALNVWRRKMGLAWRVQFVPFSPSFVLRERNGFCSPLAGSLSLECGGLTPLWLCLSFSPLLQQLSRKMQS
jgi:hypothetical protein